MVGWLRAGDGLWEGVQSATSRKGWPAQWCAWSGAESMARNCRAEGRVEVLVVCERAWTREAVLMPLFRRERAACWTGGSGAEQQRGEVTSAVKEIHFQLKWVETGIGSSLCIHLR